MLWEEGIKYFLKSEETISIFKNLNDLTLDYTLKELSSRNTYDGRIPYFDVLEDEVEMLKILLENWKKGNDKDKSFYGKDLVVSAGIGNLIMVRNLLFSFKIT